uniref:CD36 family protein n=1 Tax=Heterorhabditis bacteriophora TaxID=37862 RepID=A0A1I7X6U7_HETBA
MLLRQWICGGISIVLFVVGAGLLTAGLIIVLSVFPNTIENTVKTSKILGLNQDGTLNIFTNSWSKPTYISTKEYWTFDYTNTIGILNRAIFPDVREKGPYAYDEKINNDHISFTPDGEKMTFSQTVTYVFNADKSCKTCDPKKDTVTIPDISFFKGIQIIDHLIETVLHNKLLNVVCNLKYSKEKCSEIGKTIEKEISVAMSLFKVEPFVTVTVDELLFSGYNSPLIEKLINRIIQIMNTLLGDERFQKKPMITVKLNSENGTTDTVYTAQTGKTDWSKTGYIISFANLTNASLPSLGNRLPNSWWPSAATANCKDDYGEHALKIEGTNANFFKSFIKKTETLPVYIADVCRSTRLVFEKEVKVNGIPGYRFILPASEFDYTLEENCGFCRTLQFGAYDKPKNSSCLPSGLLDISGCQNGRHQQIYLGNPIIISKPHFYQASPIVQAFVPRFSPSYSDETTIDIEPTTGALLSAKKKLQINMLVNQFTKIGAYSVIRPGAYPLVWLNESSILDEDTKQNLQTKLFTPQNTVQIACWTAVGVGGSYHETSSNY